ncbi:uncharacterized protein LOC131025617 [Salvia miltiorrhiza]|uniref:uncharacterized protein LOC131025617 n=1 Tax=Salvia miltiorrhiza TaxID=226208 RepID=UPI0025ABF42D|nr:uncharacterized protein LOC131025617 [Salvia miltiorrhiza]
MASPPLSKGTAPRGSAAEPRAEEAIWGVWFCRGRRRRLRNGRQLCWWRRAAEGGLCWWEKAATLLVEEGGEGGRDSSAGGRQDAESIDHIFWACGQVKEVWSSFLAWFGVEYLSECVDLHSFLVEAWNLNFSPQITSFWKAGIVTLVWKIWHDRNKIVFDNAGFHGPGVLNFIKVYFKEMEANFTRLGHVSSAWQDYVITRAIGVQSRIAPPPEMVNVYWWPPFGDWMKVNTDGSALGAPGLISAGGVFRDSWGQIRGCFHEKGGQGFAFEAELLAVITAISIAHEQGWLKLWIEADSSYVVNLLDRKSEDVPWRFVAHWKCTLQLLSSFQLQVTHIFREGNVVADIMANHNREEGW